MEEKMKNIRIMTAKIITFFAQLNFFSTMNKCKNFAKLVICAFAISGLVACSGGGGGTTATDGGNDPVNITDRVNSNALNTYTLANLDTTFLNEIEQQIEDNAADEITITISNDSDNKTVTEDVTLNGDNWKTEEINITSLVSSEDGDTELTITITYFNGDDEIGTPTARVVTITVDGTPPSILDFTDKGENIPSFLPITNNEGFDFTITFNESINTDTFTTENLDIKPDNLDNLVSINVSFNSANTVATITATTDIPTDQTGNLIISVGKDWTDTAGNEATTDRTLYTIDVQRPTVLSVESVLNTSTPAIENDYTVTYTFSENIEEIANTNFVITIGTETITPTTIDHSEKTVTFTITTAENEITISATGFTDNSGNVGTDENREVNLGAITVSGGNSTIGDDNITLNASDNYQFTLVFTNEIPASSLTISDFDNSNANDNITIVSITPTTGTTTNFTVEFSITDEDDTAAVDFTIAAGTVGVDLQTNSEDIVISIDRDPRVLDVTGDEFFLNIQQIGTDNVISYTFTFSEAINGLSASDFEIDPANSGVSATAISFTNDKTGATVTFTVDANNVDGTFSIALPDDSYTDQANNGNRETNAVLPIDIPIDNIAPTVTSPAAGDYEVTTQSFNITIEFSEELRLTAVQDGNIPILMPSDVVITNVVENPIITVENSGGKGRVVIKATIDDSGNPPTITINGSAYSDTLGNTGESDYVLTIPLTSIWLTAGGTDCQNFAFDGGTGSDSNPYQISNICQIQNIDDDNITAGGVSYTDLLDKNYILIADIDANYTRNWGSGQGFNPVGGNSGGINQYTGTFDGNDYAIHNLYINRPNTTRVGLFGHTAEGSEIKQVAVVHSYIVGDTVVGGIIGQVQGTVRASAVSGSISGTGNVGGLFGTQNGSGKAKENNISSVSVKTTMNVAGILIGLYIDNVLFTNSLNNNIGVGSVVGNNSVGIVGIQQLSSSTFNNNLGLASINGNSDVGGLIGQQQIMPATNNNYWNTEVSGQLIGVGNVDPDPNGVTGVTSTQAITDSETHLSGLGFGDTDAWENIDDFSYPVLKQDNALDATEQTIFIAHGLFRLAVLDVDSTTAQTETEHNFLGDDNIQDDITLTASNFSANSPLTVIDTNLEAINDVSRVDYFACEDGDDAATVADTTTPNATGEILTTTTVGKVALSVKKTGGNIAVKRTTDGSGGAHGCQLELPTAPSAGDTLTLDATFTKATAGETCATPDDDGYYRRLETDTTTNEEQQTIYFCSYTRRFNINFE